MLVLFEGKGRGYLIGPNERRNVHLCLITWPPGWAGWDFGWNKWTQVVTESGPDKAELRMWMVH